MSAGHEVGSWVLSQWWESDFEVDGVTYRSAEHFMMAGKARLFGDDEALARILDAETPAAAKRLGGDNPKARHPKTWRGQNLLGFALMEARVALRG